MLLSETDVRNLVDWVPAASLLPQTLASTADGTSKDLGATPAEALVEVAVGTAVGDTSATVKIQDSPDDSVWTDVAAANLVGGVIPAPLTSANDNAVYKRYYTGGKRYLRVICSAISGATPGLPISATITAGRAVERLRPTELRDLLGALDRVPAGWGSQDGAGLAAESRLSALLPSGIF